MVLGRLDSWLAWGFVLSGAALLVNACSDSSSRDGTSNIADGGGAGKSGSATSAGSGVAGGGGDRAGSATGGNPQAGFGGTLPAAAEGGVAGHGGEPGQAGMPGGGAPVGGAGGEGGSGGAGEQCDTAPVTQPPAAVCAVAPSVSQEYQAGVASDKLSFGVRLRATGYFGAVHVNEVEVHYYYSQEETSGFQASVDSYVLQPSGLDLGASSEISIVPLDPHQSSTSGPGCQTHFIRIRNTSPVELLPGTQDDSYAELHVTLTPNNPAPPNQNHEDDHSYAPEATSWEQTARLGVYHCGGITSGCTPGDGGTCD